MRLAGLRITASAVAIMLTALCLAPPASAAPALTTTCDFSEGDILTAERRGHDVVSIDGLRATLELGRPELPVRYVRFALPDGMTATGVTADVRDASPLEGRFDVWPVQPQQALSLPYVAEWREPDPTVYNTSGLYPATPARLVDTGNIGGHAIATVAVYPLQYEPTTGLLTLNRSIEISLDLSPADRSLRRPLARSERAETAVTEHVRSMVENPDDVLSSPTLRSRDAGIDYLIITGADYVDEFQPLADWKTDKGVPADIVTTAWIYSNYAGVDNQEKIRNCIIDYYTSQGTTWILLAGDTDVVPARTAFATDVGSSSENALQCDLYFSDLDGTWNGDGDSTWGEITQDTVDLYADVFVGRAPVNTSVEASRFVTKVLTYEGAPAGNTLPTDYQEKMLFLAEVLWDEPWTDGGICKDMIDDDSVPSLFDPITKLYQTNGQLTKSRTLSELSSGQNITNHMGHANYNVMSIGSSALYNSDMDGLSNYSRQGIWYTIGCWPAAIDYNCIAEHWMNSQGGGVAFIGNSRYGWGSPGSPGNGTSDRYDREFFRQLFNEGQDVIGIAHAAHKDEFVSEARTDGTTRYVLYELNLLGDPEMRIWTTTPSSATVNHPGSVPLSGEPFLVTVRGSDDQALPGALLYFNNAEIAETFTTGPDGIATVDLDPTMTGSVTMTITGPGVLPYSETLPITDAPADTTPPADIETLTAADPFDLGSEIMLDWTGYGAPSDFASYRLYRATESFSDVSGRTPVAAGLLSAGETMWNDTTVDDLQPYYYAVVAVDLWGNVDETVTAVGPIASSVNARILLWDADDGDQPFDGVGDAYSVEDGTEVAWVDALDSIGELYKYAQTLPADLSPYGIVVYLGGVVNFGGLNVQMTEEEAAALLAFTDAGGSLYIEEPNFGGQYSESGSASELDLWDRFHCAYTMGNAKLVGNVQTLAGQSGGISEGMSFSYDYQDDPDQFVGRITPDDPGTELLWADQGAEGRATVYVDAGSGARRYMASVLLGAMTGGGYPSTHVEYVTRLLDDLALIGTTGVDDVLGAASHRLDQNSPNPFNPTTNVQYFVASGNARVHLAVYDVRGRVVATLVDGSSDAGEHTVIWDGTDTRGHRVSSGIYFLRAEIDGWKNARKMVLLK